MIMYWLFTLGCLLWQRFIGEWVMQAHEFTNNNFATVLVKLNKEIAMEVLYVD